MTMTFDEILQTNGTCRYYKTDSVSDDVLGRVLDAARWVLLRYLTSKKSSS
jgi:nitroreductase